jgi:hypothetical protein
MIELLTATCNLSNSLVISPQHICGVDLCDGDDAIVATGTGGVNNDDGLVNEPIDELPNDAAGNVNKGGADADAVDDEGGTDQIVSPLTLPLS